MFRTVFCVAAALFTFGVATVSAAADDRATCGKSSGDELIAACSRVLARDPREAVAYHNRGVAYYLKHDYDRAIADYDQAIRLDPKYASAYHERGKAYRAKGDYDRLMADLDQAIRLDPKFANAYNERGL